MVSDGVLPNQQNISELEVQAILNSLTKESSNRVEAATSINQMLELGGRVIHIIGEYMLASLNASSVVEEMKIWNFEAFFYVCICEHIQKIWTRIPESDLKKIRSKAANDVNPH
ncbi:hypothetical protein HGM15179_013191 [Zosterops borbonicus]|uniref:Uncharacterized protein n=1 Tax=Zosterops borbonicus TaxID=364589 RepID=A0A8K1G8I3_9PASS|nr:hypothetical protein HGM15179_013191 [Zosterops borbonicus]